LGEPSSNLEEIAVGVEAYGVITEVDLFFILVGSHCRAIIAFAFYSSCLCEICTFTRLIATARRWGNVTRKRERCDRPLAACKCRRVITTTGVSHPISSVIDNTSQYQNLVFLSLLVRCCLPLLRIRSEYRIPSRNPGFLATGMSTFSVIF
jgi:hypothetical protein